MQYISIKEASALWGIDTSNIGKLCRKGKIEGAKLVGKSWLIPKNATKPLDGRTKVAKENQNASAFRLPLYVNFPEDSFVPPLSKEEANLRQAQVNFFSCEFQKSTKIFDELSESAENVYVRICAHFFMCILSAVYDMSISWEKHYYRLNLLLAEDSPHKKEMELFTMWLDFIIGQYRRIPEKLNTDSTYEYHPSAWYLHAFLSVFNYSERYSESSNIKCSEPFETLCKIMERDGYYIEEQELHAILFGYHYTANNKETMLFHLRKVVALAYEHDLLFTIADAATYYADVVDIVLREYPASFVDQVHTNSKIIGETFSQFAKKTANTRVYERLSKNDYRYAFYAVKGFSNKQVADMCNLSERTVANKYNDIYNKLGVNSKQELVQELSIAFGE